MERERKGEVKNNNNTKKKLVVDVFYVTLTADDA
jgi:hypothetical protein